MRKVWRRLCGRRFKITVVALVVALLAGGAFLQVSVDRCVTARDRWDESSPFDSGRSVLDLLGGVRQTLAAYFWTKTDDIFHEYTGHSTADTKFLFPYYWMITRLDTHFEMSFYYASYMLCVFGHPKAGLNLAIEGMKYNPDSALLQENLASIYFFFKKDPAKAGYHNRKAIELEKDPDQALANQVFQNVIDQVLAGKKKIPEKAPVQEYKCSDPECEHNKDKHEH
ncbi:MAG: hypothetical protein CVT63_02625 [Candidatus Anoxymicrobium japonicum]|uniref:Uncharacterized protein n=1 Tax=Candidatus Anoxymicrobium japonicum TaxID=2013648 RepID=A0A2N3G6W2_9ACTN|nr:MAG: hypothetical protein CVT63_02625 [Candidatus Anoxymicrobium japonicum]